MRLVAIGLALALSASAPLAAQAPVSTQPLANGEVLLQLGAIGVETVPADLATITVSISGQGTTEAAARAELADRYRRVVAAARQAGVPASAISQSEIRPIADMRTFDVREEPPPGNDVDAVLVNAAEAEPSPSMYLSSTVTIRVTDIARIDALRSALEAPAGVESGGIYVTYSLSDSRAARQAARARALATVRAEAEAYAASLNMRVGRIVRISERTGTELLPQLLGDPSLMRSLGPASGMLSNRASSVTVPVAVGVDFVLTPR